MFKLPSLAMRARSIDMFGTVPGWSRPCCRSSVERVDARSLAEQVNQAK
jgi:hypothetical protein